ncbi:MAG: hypothetical protein GWM98_11385, partial [Nitrospinaceae bacterium]|nr:hypothetical protein [Nitrospinaceae bacterium]NIR54991.1 hypothetical protein [Nitrospinaceae bacterium]NIS85405.1 hypothetical protein [Nitrospinaceae bacterium]NIT82231.1 hypothetical protein [Nitrospinaceae bacterium]NIU44475.1 hypothetical protein [Nitrospinaceae bacterium]
MNLYQLMRNYAQGRGLLPAPDLPAGELGKSLALFHNCLAEAGLSNSQKIGEAHVTAGPEEIVSSHLSRFVVGYLPFNSVSTKAETNEILFDLFSFLRWLDKESIPHGLSKIDFQQTIQELTRAQDRCLQLSHFLDDETGRVLEEPPRIVDTVNDLFLVIKIDRRFVFLQGQQHENPIRLRLPEEIL